jgi:NAD-specific glutamate dehydrogenase
MQDDLLAVRRRFAWQALTGAAGRPADDVVQAFLGAKPEALARLGRFMRALALDGTKDLASLIVALRQIRALDG